MGSSRQEYCCGEAIPIYRGSSRPGIEPGSPALQADSLSFGPNTGEKGSLCLPGFPGQEEKWKAISTGCGKCHEDGAAAGTLEKAPKPRKNFLKKIVFKLKPEEGVGGGGYGGGEGGRGR